MNYVKCNKCKWISFVVSLQYCKEWLEDWKKFWPTLSDEGKEAYGLKDGPPTIIDEFLNCHRCNNSYKDFTDATDEELDRIYGSTINPILNRSETYEV